MAFTGETAALYSRFLDGDREVRNELIRYVDDHFKDLSLQSEGGLRECCSEFPERFPLRVLSLGDGPGAPGLEVAQQLRDQYGSGPVQFEVYSTDLSKDMSQQARERAREAGFCEADSATSKSAVSVKFIAPLSADDPVALRQHFSDGSVDVVLMSFLLMFVGDREACFAEAARMLRPGGKLVFCVLNQFLMIDLMSNALDEVLRDEDMNSKLCQPIRPVPCLALKDWAVYVDNHIDGSDEEVSVGFERFLREAAPSLEVESWGIVEYDFPLRCREGEEDLLLDMFCSLISDESWAAICKRAPHLQGSLEQARREVRDYVTDVVVHGPGRGENRWRFDEDGRRYEGDMYCCPGYAAPVVCCQKRVDDAIA